MTTRNLNTARKTFGAGALVALAVLFIGVTILITFVLRGARIDLTESNLYSIAPGTQHILSSLKEPINLYFFFSQEASSRVAAAARLRAARARAAGRNGRSAPRASCKLTVDRSAAVLGGRGPRRGVRPAGGAAGRARRVAVLRPRRHELDRRPRNHRLLPAGQGRVSRVRRREPDPSAEQPEEADRRPDVGAAGRCAFDQHVRPHAARAGRASRSCTSCSTCARSRPTSQRSTQDIDVLMVMHPKELSPQTLYAIDQFVMRGGKLIAFVDPQSENDPAGQQGGPMAMVPRSSSLGPLLDAWGVAFDPGAGARRSRARPHGLAAAGPAAFAAHRDRRLQSRQHEHQGRRDRDARHDQRHDRRRAQEEGRRDDRSSSR